MPCFYIRNQASIALFKIDPVSRSPIAELVPSLNLAKLIKETLSANCYTVQNIYEDDDELNKAESDLISGKTKKTPNQSEVQTEYADGEDSEHLDLDDLMEEMNEPINLAEADNLKLSSMHHFKLKPRDVVQVYRFSGRQSCHALYMKLLNYVSLMNDKRKSTKEGP